MTGASSRKGGRLRVRREYAHPPERVWRALTEAELLARWLMPNDFRAQVGHAFTFTTEPGPGFDGIVHCEVLAIDAPRHMTWSWRGGPLDTVVTFDLTPTAGGGTELLVTHSGFRGVRARLVQWILGIGNRTLYGKRLPEVLDELRRARHAGDGGEPVSTPPAPSACMSWWQRVLVAANRLVPKRRDRARGVD